jgi:phage tail tape-measure protein
VSWPEPVSPVRRVRKGVRRSQVTLTGILWAHLAAFGATGCSVGTGAAKGAMEGCFWGGLAGPVGCVVGAPVGMIGGAAVGAVAGDPQSETAAAAQPYEPTREEMAAILKEQHPNQPDYEATDEEIDRAFAERRKSAK